MNYDMSSYFEDPEFKEALAKYEGMVENHTPAYFEADELIDIAEYYTLKAPQASDGESMRHQRELDVSPNGWARRLRPTGAVTLPAQTGR